MSKSKVSVKLNTEKINKNIDNSGRYITETLARQTASETRKLLLRGGRSGNKYQIPETNVYYTASAPGEPPAPRTGNLASSYRHKQISDYKAIVFSDLVQALWEFGIDGHAARPHLRPAATKVMKNYLKSTIGGAFRNG